MQLLHWILAAAFLAVAYAATKPLDLTAVNQSQDVSDMKDNVRQKRFILAKKALLVGGAVGLGVGLAKGKLLGGGWHHPVYAHSYPVYYSYPVYHYPVHHYPVYEPHGYGGGGGGWSGASAYASAGAGSW